MNSLSDEIWNTIKDDPLKILRIMKMAGLPRDIFYRFEEDYCAEMSHLFYTDINDIVDMSTHLFIDLRDDMKLFITEYVEGETFWKIELFDCKDLIK